MSLSLKVSVIICSLDGCRQGNVPRLLKQLVEQSLPEFEILVVQGVSPCSKAHNDGVRSSKGEILVFLDDDVQLGDNMVIENLVESVNCSDAIGIVGASQLIPGNSTRFQKHCAKELFRVQSPIVNKLTESDMATHAAMAISRRVYGEVGGEKEELLRTDDVYLRYMVGKKGYKIFLAPDTWVFHPPPTNITSLLKGQFENGIAYAHDYKYFPENVYYSPLDGDQLKFPKKSSYLLQIVRNLRILLCSLRNIHIFGLLSRLAIFLGVFWGLMHKRDWFKTWLLKSKKAERKILMYQREPIISIYPMACMELEVHL
ncbi:MAG: glycosyltransferase [Candidatus Hodarchaeota archaeon]